MFGRTAVDPRSDQFRELLELTRQRGIRVERFARVACPANGTLLASRRIDRYASYLFNVLKLAPGLQGTGVVEAVKLLVLTFLDQRSDTMVLPGLEAQMPESPFIGTLNARAKVCADDGMGAVAGDVEGSGIVKRLKVLGADAFFLGDHDMVVNTRAMVGGVPRKFPRVATFRGSAYSHSNYFTDEATRTASLRWLTDADGDGKPETEFIDHLVSKRRWWGSQRGDRTTKHEESVLIVPDLLGSTIEIDGDPVWPDPPGISRLGVEAFLASDQWKPSGLVDRYDPLVGALEQAYVKVVPFPYDGRGTLEDTARLLLEQITNLLDDPDVPDPLHVVTHGAGGRILRVAQRLQPDVVARLGRRVLLSPPLSGSALVAARAAGRDPLTASLAVLAGTTAAEVGGWMDKNWLSLKELAAAEPAPEADGLPWTDTTAVYGRALTTLAPGPAARNTRAGGATYHLSTAGDGHVLWPGPDSEPPARFVNTPFDELVSATAPLELVRALLTQEGDTRTGSTQRPVVRTDLTDAPTEYPALFPDPGDLIWRSMGAPARRRSRTSSRSPSSTATSPPRASGSSSARSTARPSVARRRRSTTGSRERCSGTAWSASTPARWAPAAVRPPRQGGPGAAVIGIGDAGDITPGALTAGIAQAVMRLVAARPDESHSNPEDRYLDVATVLIGTTSLGGLNVASAVHAAITGVRRANRRILDLGLDTQVRRLRVYELYEDRANEALQAALRIRSDSDAAEANGLAITDLLEEGVDGLPGSPPTTYSADRWRTIRVSTPKVATGAGSDQMDLFFNEIGRTAGAETLLSQGQRKIIDELIEGCVRTPYVDEQTYNTLYELVVPRPMKGQGRPSEHMMYLLDDNAAKLPFEMFATRSFDDRLIPTSTEVGIIRRLEVGQLATSTRPSSGRRALVIGDPDAGDNFDPLPGARQEAEAVADLLEARRFRVTRLIARHDRDSRVSTVAVLNALFAHEYRIVHIAAHGTPHEPGKEESSGVLIGPDTRLTAMELRQMQTTPDMVFLNACHTGADVSHANELAATVARQFINNGVRAIVAAGWAVDDEPAAEFAKRFYAGLLDGENLGTSTLQARRTVYNAYKATSNTWGAYQVYGEPAFQFERDTSGRAPEPPRSRLDFHTQLDRLSEEVAAFDGVDSGRLVKTLDALQKRGQKYGWLDGSEYQHVGKLWRDLAEYDRAILAFQRALGGGGSAASLDIVAQLVSAHAHEGAERARTGQKDDGHFEVAEQLIEQWRGLVQSSSTPGLDHARCRANLEQHRLWTVDPSRKEFDERLEEVIDAFDRAGKGHESPAVTDAYAEFGSVLFRWVAWERHHSGNGRPPRRLADRAECLVAAAEAAPWSSAPFQRQRTADAELLLHFLRGKPSSADVIDGYERAFQKGASPRERESVTVNLELLLRVLPESASRRQTAVDLLRALREREPAAERGLRAHRGPLKSRTPPTDRTSAGGVRVGQMAMATSATEPRAATTRWSTGSDFGARVRSVHSPSPAKNRNWPCSLVGTSAVNSPVRSSSRT